MADVMLTIGYYQFSVNRAAYQELTRSSEYTWAQLERIGTSPALQHVGYSETVGLRGVIFPEYRGGLGQLDAMRTIASIGTPLPLISGAGRVLGLWVIESIMEGQTVFAQSGVPLRQEFEMRLRRFDGGLRSLLPF